MLARVDQLLALVLDGLHASYQSLMHEGTIEFGSAPSREERHSGRYCSTVQIEIHPEDILHSKVVAAIGRQTQQLGLLLPGATVEHIGATAVPGALTKGDVDLLVAVPADRFDSSIKALRSHYAAHQPEEWMSDLASFKEEPSDQLPVGIQLVIAGGRSERIFLKWRDLLREDPELLGTYNKFKSVRAGRAYDEYTEAKAVFIERALGESLSE